MVPDVRIAGLATRRAAWAEERPAAPHETPERARCSACVAMAPTVQASAGRARISARAVSRCSDIRRSGLTSPSRIMGTRAVSRRRRAAPRRRAGRARRARRSGTRARRAERRQSHAQPRVGRRRQHRLDDLGVAGTAAEVPEQRFRPRRLGGRGVVGSAAPARPAGCPACSIRTGPHPLGERDPAAGPASPVGPEPLDRDERAPASAPPARGRPVPVARRRAPCTCHRRLRRTRTSCRRAASPSRRRSRTVQ